MANVVARAKTSHRAYVIGVDFAIVACHSLSHAPNIAIASTQERIPEPIRSGKLGIVPSKSANIISPLFALSIVGMHHIAIVPKAIPMVVVDGIAIDVNPILQLLLHPTGYGIVGSRGIIAYALPLVSKTPASEGLLRMEIVGSRKQTRTLGKNSCQRRQRLLGRQRGERNKGDFAGASNTIRGTHTLLYILVARDETMSHGVVVAKIHRLTLRTPKVDSELRLISTSIRNLQSRWILLPKIFQRQS